MQRDLLLGKSGDPPLTLTLDPSLEALARSPKPEARSPNPQPAP